MFVTNDHTRNTRCALHNKFVLPLTKNNRRQSSLKYRGSKILYFLIGMRLIPSKFLEKIPHQVEDVIHNLKEYVKNLPDHAVEDILR